MTTKEQAWEKVRRKRAELEQAYAELKKAIEIEQTAQSLDYFGSKQWFDQVQEVEI